MQLRLRLMVYVDKVVQLSMEYRHPHPHILIHSLTNKSCEVVFEFWMVSAVSAELPILNGFCSLKRITKTLLILEISNYDLCERVKNGNSLSTPLILLIAYCLHPK
jgi:hypothetical protein